VALKVFRMCSTQLSMLTAILQGHKDLSRHRDQKQQLQLEEACSVDRPYKVRPLDEPRRLEMPQGT